MAGLGAPELLLIFLVVLLLFGVGRVSRVGGELGSAIREFRKGLQGNDEENKPSPNSQNPQTPQQ